MNCDGYDLVKEVIVVGKYCELGDVLFWDILLLEVKVGDLLVISSMGVYGYLMVSNYNWNFWLVVVFVEDG